MNDDPELAITDEEVERFEYLAHSIMNRKAALVSTRRKADNARIVLVAILTEDGDMIDCAPLAELLGEDSIDNYYDPTTV